jgi:hypothetical protein
MTTIGYGDIVVNPWSTSEIWMMIGLEIFCTTVFAYCIGTLVNIIINFDPAAKNRSQNLQFLNQYLTGMHSSLAFRKCVRFHVLHMQKVIYWCD